MNRNIPNILSLVRIPCAVLIALLYSDKEIWRFEASMIVLAAALATDFIDGSLSRKFGITSKHGYVIDGLGDRAVYIALFLSFLVQGEIGLLSTWLLIFREVAIYAARLFSDQWYEANRAVRFLSRLHAGLLRIWILTVLITGAASLYGDVNLGEISGFYSARSTLLYVTIAVSYYSLARHLRAILATVDPSLRS